MATETQNTDKSEVGGRAASAVERLVIRPCPFCGDKCPTIEGDETTGLAVRCIVCGGEGGEAFSKSAAVHKWNRRDGEKLAEAAGAAKAVIALNMQNQKGE